MHPESHNTRLIVDFQPQEHIRRHSSTGETEPSKRSQRPEYVQDAAPPGQRPLRPRRPERVRRQAPLLWGRQQNAFADNFRAFRLMIAFVTYSERVLAPSVEVVLEVVRNSVSKQ